MPQGDRVRAGQGERVERVAVAVAAREDDDADPHAHRQPSPRRDRRRPTVTAGADRRRRGAERLDRVDLDERVRQQLRGEALDDRARGRLVGGLDRQLGPPADADVVDALDAEVAEAALDGPAAGIEDAGLGRHVDGVPKARHGAITSSCR